jgi:uncharacterized protein YqeY
MSYLERIQNDLTTAMKGKDELRLSVLRMVKSALKNKEIEKMHALERERARARALEFDWARCARQFVDQLCPLARAA